MTKKDYISIAHGINLCYQKNKDLEPVVDFLKTGLVPTLGYQLLLDNPRFNQAKFEEACFK